MDRKRITAKHLASPPTIREDPNPDVEFYYRQQFRIYCEPYLIWDRDTWEIVFGTCTVFRIEIDGEYAGDVILEDRGEGEKYIADFSLLPEYQGKGVGRAVLDRVKEMARLLTAVTRRETLPFFLKCGFVLNHTLRNYYRRRVDGYFISFSAPGQDQE
jgi:GNAT superfamily N-acetyltransferase